MDDVLTKNDVESGDEVAVVVEREDGERVQYDGVVTGTRKRRIVVEVEEGVVDSLEIGVDGEGCPGGAARWRRGKKRRAGDVVEFRRSD